MYIFQRFPSKYLANYACSNSISVTSFYCEDFFLKYLINFPNKVFINQPCVSAPMKFLRRQEPSRSLFSHNFNSMKLIEMIFHNLGLWCVPLASPSELFCIFLTKPYLMDILWSWRLIFCPHCVKRSNGLIVLYEKDIILLILMWMQITL